MNILFLSTWFPFPPDNGCKIRAFYLLRSLAEAHRVTLVAFNPNPQDPFTAPPNVAVYPVQADPFRYVRLPQIIKYLSPVPLAFWRNKKMEAKLEQLRKQEQWDAIVALEVMIASYALRFADIPRVLDIDTALSYQLYERYQEQRTRTGRWRAWISWYKAYRYECALFQRFPACTLVSSAEVMSVQAMAGAATRVEVIRNGVDCTHHHPGLAEVRPNTLVYNGALTYSANYDAMRYFLAEIYPLIKQEVPDITLSITGSTKGVDVHSLQLDDSVRLTGYVDDIRLPVASSTLCVVPIRQGGGTRLKILEAMALGTPVVATSKGAEGLDAVAGKHLLVADSPSDFAAATVSLLKDDALRRRLATQARTLMEAQYGWGSIGQQFVQLVEDTVLQHG